MTSRGIILEKYPVINIIYSFFRSIFALIGICMTWFYLELGFTEYYQELSFTFWYVIHAVLVFLNIKGAFRKDKPTQGEQMASGRESFEIADNGDVSFFQAMEDSGDVLARLKKETHMPSDWQKILKKYPRNSFKGQGWDKVRGHCLSQMKKVKNSFEIVDTR
jgi:hypothetical protein